MKKILFIPTFLLISLYTMAQGCSDAGFCSLKYHASTEENKSKNSITIGNVSGLADGKTFINGTYLTYKRELSRNWNWDTRITANFASGALANNFNIGDVFTNLSYQVFASKSSGRSLQLLGGIKIPLSGANDKASGKPLPMAYQSSLGTWDALLGLQYRVKEWEFTNAYQIPLTGQNKNTFIKEYSTTSDFPTTNKFDRKADVLLRVAYEIKTRSKQFNLKPNILAIYHTGKDSYEDLFSKRQVLNGSEGLTLNANIIGNYRFNVRNALELSLATPFLVRDIRPDGLTRKYTVAIEYQYSF